MEPTTYSPWYSLLVVGGSILAILIMYLQWRNKKLVRYHFWLLVPVVSFFAIYGARWWYLAFNPSDYNSIIDIFIPFAGRSIMGSIVAVFIVLFVYAKYWGGDQVEFRQLITIVLPNMLLAQSIGRWGNFFNQEVYGVAVESLAWLPDFIETGMYIDGEYRAPLFLYESILDMLAWVIIIFVIGNIKWFKTGTQAGFYLLFYGTIRASLELFRDPQFIMHIGYFPTSFFWAIVFAMWGFGLIIYYQYYYEKTSWYINSSFAQSIKIT